MKFRFIWVGKTRNKHYLSLQEEYLTRLGHFVKCETIEVRDANGPDAKAIEGNRILEKLNHSSVVCLLDVEGSGVSSRGLAAEVDGISVRVRLPLSDERAGPRDQVVAVERVRLVAHAHGWRPHSDTATPDGQGDYVTVSPTAP